MKLKKILLNAISYFTVKSKIYLFPEYYFRRIKGIKRFTIVNYHRVLPKEFIDKSLSQSSLIVSLENFKAQLDYFMTKYNILSINSVLNFSKPALDSSKPNLIITFDDGWYDNYLYAFDELKKRNIPATVYLATNYISTDKLFWPEEITFLLINFNKMQLIWDSENKIKKLFSNKIYQLIVNCIHYNSVVEKKNEINKLIIRLKSYPIESIKRFSILLSSCKKHTYAYRRICADRMLTWKEINEMRDYKITFGSHSHNHIILNTVSSEEADIEIRKSKNLLLNKLKNPVVHFSLPNGGCNNNTRQLLKNNGFKTNVSCINGIANMNHDKLMLHRKHINEDRFVDKNGNLCNWKCDFELSGLFDPFKNFFLKYGKPY